jgi:hypothetical protein
MKEKVPYWFKLSRRGKIISNRMGVPLMGAREYLELCLR